MNPLDDIRRQVAEAFPYGAPLAYAAIDELARRQDFILSKLQTLGIAREGWPSMEIWEQSRGKKF